MSLLLSLFLVSAQEVQGPKLETPRELLTCGTDDSLDSRLCRATVSGNEKRYAESAAAFEGAAALAGNNYEQRARIELAASNMWLAAGMAQEADAAIVRALEWDTMLSPMQRGFARIDRARIALALGNDGGALAHLVSAEPFVANDPFLWFLKSTIQLDRGEVEEARISLDKGLDLAADAPELLLLAGHVAMAEGKPARARAEWAAAATHEDHPSGIEAAALLAEMEAQSTP